MYKKLKLQVTQPDMILYTSIVYSNPFPAFLQASIPLELELIRPFYELKQWEKRPLLVWVCGGAFRASTPMRNIPSLVEYAKQGYVVASIRYRINDDAGFPAQVQDVKTAIRFLKHHHEKYGINPEKVVIAGHSAGAYLAAMVAATDGVEFFETEEWNDVSSSVKGAVCMAGGDFFLVDRNQKEYTSFFRSLEDFLKCPLHGNEELIKKASPSQYLSKDTPPVLLIHGEKDAMVPIETNKRFYEELTNAGVRADFYEIEGAGHGTVELWQPEIQKLMLDFFNNVIED